MEGADGGKDVEGSKSNCREGGVLERVGEEGGCGGQEHGKSEMGDVDIREEVDGRGDDIGEENP